MPPRSPHYDLIIVGSGIAGLYAALRAADRASVLLVTKADLEESNTVYAQGGIAVALGADDSPALHSRDTLAAGGGLCDEAGVSTLTDEAPARILDLLARGVPFDRENGGLAWTLEAAHSRPRVLHAGGDATGRSIEITLASLVRMANVEILDHSAAIDLVLRDGAVGGLDLLRSDGTEERVSAGAVLLATGGAGQLFARTTNPAGATGDGAAIAYRAGAELMDTEFVQFHPTALALPGAPSFLVSEAVRGEGGILRDDSGRAFMAGYHPDRELAPRDVVARAIHQQMGRLSSPNVWLDITHLDPAFIEGRFPTIVAFCRALGIDPVSAMIPVAPAAHYWMGGVRTDLDGRTSIPGLFAAGEVACTGVHGANRLASNSLLEGLVFAARATDAAMSGDGARMLGEVTPEVSTVPIDGNVSDRSTIAESMWRHASLVRSADSLAAASEAMTRSSGAELDRQSELETRNLMLLANVILAAASFREESRGAHYRSDFPGARREWQAHTVISRRGIGRTRVVETAVPVHA